jgi:N-acetylmuramoyl-L-alanine amidase
MPDEIPRDEDSEFKEWASKRDPEEPSDVPASVTFMEMMRQAAAKKTAAEGRVEQIVDTMPLETQTDGGSEPPTVVPPPPVRRVRRKPKRSHTAVSVIGGLLRAFIIVIVAAGLMATIFTWWTPNGFISDSARAGLSIAIATDAVTQVPTALPTPNWARKIGIVSGHRGNDSGAVCPDGLTEASINLSVAELVVQNLRGMGYTVDLLDEFDPRLENYQAATLLSIHSNTCQDFGEAVNGFIVAAAAARISAKAEDTKLVECIADHYAATTKLVRRSETTVDMTDYHTFREIQPLTPAAIIELGFMRGDRQILTQHPDTLARGLTDGILCFLEPGKS